MKKIISAGLAFSMACLLFISCQKSSIEKIEPVQKESLFSSAKNLESFAKSVKDFYTKNANAINGTSRASANGAHFIAPFSTVESQGIFDFDPATFQLKVAYFDAPFGNGDFYRQNNDGTVSVHINTTKALSGYAENAFDPNSLRLQGQNAHFSGNYTGMVYENFFYDENWNIIGSYFVLGTWESGRAVSWRGSGKVGVNGIAPWRNLTANLVQTPGGQITYNMSLQ